MAFQDRDEAAIASCGLIGGAGKREIGTRNRQHNGPPAQLRRCARQLRGLCAAQRAFGDGGRGHRAKRRVLPAGPRRRVGARGRVGVRGAERARRLPRRHPRAALPAGVGARLAHRAVQPLCARRRRPPRRPPRRVRAGRPVRRRGRARAAGAQARRSRPLGRRARDRGHQGRPAAAHVQPDRRPHGAVAAAARARLRHVAAGGHSAHRAAEPQRRVRLGRQGPGRRQQVPDEPRAHRPQRPEAGRSRRRDRRLPQVVRDCLHPQASHLRHPDPPIRRPPRPPFLRIPRRGPDRPPRLPIGSARQAQADGAGEGRVPAQDVAPAVVPAPGTDVRPVDEPPTVFLRRMDQGEDGNQHTWEHCRRLPSCVGVGLLPYRRVVLEIDSIDCVAIANRNGRISTKSYMAQEIEKFNAPCPPARLPRRAPKPRTLPSED